MRRPDGRVLLAALAGCSPVPDSLLEVPIVGGTPEIREAIRAELAAFEAAAGQGRARVSRIVIRDLSDPLGSFDAREREILLDDDLDLEPSTSMVPVVLRHELCHALNWEEALHRERPDLYGRHGQHLKGSYLEDRDWFDDVETLQDEVFAAYCEFGPWVTRAMASACPGDSADAAAILRHIAERVWVHSEPGPWPTEPGPAIAGIRLEHPPFEVSGMGSPNGVVRVSAIIDGAQLDPPSDEDETDRSCRDVWTGGWTFPGLCTSESPDPPAVPPGPAAAHLRHLYSQGWVEGPFAGVIASPYDADSLRRWVWYDGQRWALLGDGCDDPERALFATDGRVFDLRLDGARVQWGPAAPHLDVDPREDDNAAVRSRRIACGECQAMLSIDPDQMAGLVSCYGWNAETGWGPSTPEAIVAAGSTCEPDQDQSCHVYGAYHGTPAGIGEACQCAEGVFGEPPPAGCCPNEEEIRDSVASLPEYRALIDRIDADCNLALDVSMILQCTDPARTAQLTGPCG